MFTITRPTATVQMTVEVDRLLLEDAQEFYRLTPLGRRVMRLLMPHRYEALMLAADMVPYEVAMRPVLAPVTEKRTPKYGYLERKARGLS